MGDDAPSGTCRDSSFWFFFTDAATSEIYTLSLHDALPISDPGPPAAGVGLDRPVSAHPRPARGRNRAARLRSEEHTSELQSQSNLVCRLLLEKKNTQRRIFLL